MKRTLKKIIALFITAIIVATTVSAFTISAAAKGVFDDAKKMEQLELYSHTFKEGENTIYYRIKITCNGTIQFQLSAQTGAGSNKYYLLNSNAERVDKANYPINVGDLNGTYLKKGIYYLKTTGDKGVYFKDLYYTFTPDDKPTISLSVTIKKGSTLELGSVTENYSGKVSWLSTKPEIATVSSKGVVTAKKKGTTTIRAQLDSGEYVQIKVKVK